VRAGANLIRTPTIGFDIGTEFIYTRGITDKPSGMDVIFVTLQGLPPFKFDDERL
jgi:hypothetical protein